MKPGGQLARRTPLKAKTPLRRYTELRSTPRVLRGTSGEGSAVSAIQQPTDHVSARAWCAKRRPRTGHRLPADVRAVVRERSGGWCELQLPGCLGRASQMHHRITQKAGGRHGAAAARSDRASNLLDACGGCHQLVTDKPARARTYGFSLLEGQQPSQETVLYRGVRMYLDDAGGVHSSESVGA